MIDKVLVYNFQKKTQSFRVLNAKYMIRKNID